MGRIDVEMNALYIFEYYVNASAMSLSYNVIQKYLGDLGRFFEEHGVDGGGRTSLKVKSN